MGRKSRKFKSRKLKKKNQNHLQSNQKEIQQQSRDQLESKEESSIFMKIWQIFKPKKIPLIDFTDSKPLYYKEESNLVATKSCDSENRTTITYTRKKDNEFALVSKEEVDVLYHTLNMIRVYLDNNSELPNSIIEQIDSLPNHIRENIEPFLLSTNIKDLLREYRHINISDGLNSQAKILSSSIRHHLEKAEDVDPETRFGKIYIKKKEKFPRPYREFVEKLEEKEQLGVFKNISKKRLEKLKEVLNLDFFDLMNQRKEYDIVQNKMPQLPKKRTQAQIEGEKRQRLLDLDYEYAKYHHTRLLNYIERRKKFFEKKREKAMLDEFRNSQKKPSSD